MKSNTKAQNKALSMRDALNEFKGLKIVESRNEHKDWRDWLWNYPVFVEKVFKKTIPFSFVFVFGLVAFLFVLFLQSHTFTKFLKANSFSNTQYAEGMMGAKSTFNPLFASNNYVDKAIDSLIFQKFIYIDKNGKPTPGVAKSWSVSGDSLTYTFVIDEGLHWSDGTELTVGDILFTFNTAMALDPQVSVGAALEGVNITQIDSRTIQFVLTEANPTFFEAVSIYIVSQEELGGVALNDFSNERYASLMGSGKYFIQKNESNAVYLSDNIYDNYNPHIKKLVFRIYPDFDSLEMAMRV
jgi:ABC-type transport system substrate-binding protein